MSPTIQPDPPGALELTRLPERLRHVARPYSARELADMTCHHPERVRRYLRGETPSVGFLLAICEVLGLSADWLLRGQGPMLAAGLEREAMLLNTPLNDLLDALAWRWLRQPRSEGLSGLRATIAALESNDHHLNRKPSAPVPPGMTPHRNRAQSNGFAPRKR